MVAWLLLSGVLLGGSPSVEWPLRSVAIDPELRRIMGYDPDRLPVLVEVDAVRSGGRDALRRCGLEGGIKGRPFIGAIASGFVRPAALQRLIECPGVRAIESYIPAQVHSLLSQTTELIRTRRGSNLVVPERSNFGAGVRLVDVDVGLDFYHPAFFAPEPGSFAWLDVDGDRALSPGDGVDLDGDGALGEGETLSVLKARVNDWRNGVVDGADDQPFAATKDWLFIDQNEDGERNYRSNADESTPSYGEPLLVVEDRDGDGVLGGLDRLRRLGPSRVAAYRSGLATYRRGVDLLQVPMRDLFHGTGVWGIYAGGPALRPRSGIAPEATILHYHRDSINLLDAPFWALDEGAQVVLHEYGGWIGKFYDGSSLLTQVIEHSERLGLPHVLPAGNLASGKRSAAIEVPAGEEGLAVTLRLPERVGAEVLWGSVLWTDEVALTFELSAPGEAVAIGFPPDQLSAEDLPENRRRVAEYQRSSRHTSKHDWALWGHQGDNLARLTTGDWTLRLRHDGQGPVRVLLRIADNKKSWGGGASWEGDLDTRTHSVTWPATSDAGIVVFAYAGDQAKGGGPAGQETGALRAYSGRGPRIDGRALQGIAAPDNPHSTWPISPANGHGGYGSFNGTSGAGPHVAGALALLIGAGRSPGAAQAALLARAEVDAQVAAGPANGWGQGKLRYDLAQFDDVLPAASEALELSLDEVGEFAVLSAPAGGVFRARFEVLGRWTDWRSEPLFLERGEAVDVEVIDAFGQRRRGLQRFSVGAPSPPAPPAVSPAPAAPPPGPVPLAEAPVAPILEPLADPQMRAPGCSGGGVGWFALIALAGLRRRRRRR
jgi:hypothetical protein